MDHEVGRINAIGAPAVITSVKLTGQIEGWHYCAKTGRRRKAFKDVNTIDNELKAIIRYNLDSPSDFALDNMFPADGQLQAGGGALDNGAAGGKDGIIIWDFTHGNYVSLVTSVHPDDPEGNYYRQWQGVLSNDFGVGDFVVGGGSQGAKIGVNFNAGAAFVYDYAFGAPASVTMATNDILTINWKIAVG